MLRWWGIRHIRYYVNVYRVNRHYDEWRKLGYLPLNIAIDINALDEIWRGER